MLHSSLDDLDSVSNRDAAKSYILSWKWVGGLGGDARPVTHLYLHGRKVLQGGGGQEVLRQNCTWGQSSTRRVVGAITAKFYMGTECCKEVGRRYNGKIVQGHKVLKGWGSYYARQNLTDHVGESREILQSCGGPVVCPTCTLFENFYSTRYTARRYIAWLSRVLSWPNHCPNVHVRVHLLNVLHVFGDSSASTLTNLWKSDLAWYSDNQKRDSFMRGKWPEITVPIP